MNQPLVSVLIPSHNRFEYLQNAIESVQQQNYSNIEIIVINDCSTQEEYYTHVFDNNVTKLDLKENQKDVLGYISAGHIRNFGLKVANGKYVAFLDDDDIWLPNKLSSQIALLEASKNKMSATDGLIGKGVYNPNKEYLIYNEERFYKRIAKKHKKYFFSSYKSFNFPKEFNFNFIKIHNSIITSSVIIELNLINFIGGFRPIPTKNDYAPDYDCWLNILRLTNCEYLKTPYFYYDETHGYGREW